MTGLRWMSGARYAATKISFQVHWPVPYDDCDQPNSSMHSVCTACLAKCASGRRTGMARVEQSGYDSDARSQPNGNRIATECPDPLIHFAPCGLKSLWIAKICSTGGPPVLPFCFSVQRKACST
jgi:hypothetical protein